MNIYMTGNEWKEGKKPNMATEGKANSMWKKGKDSSCRKQKLLDSVWYKHSILKSLVMTGTMIHNISVWPGGKQWKPRQMVRSTTIVTKKESSKLKKLRHWTVHIRQLSFHLKRYTQNISMVKASLESAMFPACSRSQATSGRTDPCLCRALYNLCKVAHRVIWGTSQFQAPQVCTEGLGDADAAAVSGPKKGRD